jgi:hypothetical protein
MRSVRVVLTLGLAFVIGVLASACGSGVASAPERSVASPPEPPNYSGLEVHSLAQAGFNIGVPQGWTTMTGEDSDRARLDAIVAEEPTLAAQRDVLTQDDAPLKLIAVHYDPEDCSCSTVSVMAFPLNDAWKEDFADEEGFADGAAELALPGTKPTWKRVKTPVAEGVRITLRTTLPGSDAEVIMTQNYLHTSTSVYIVSYTTSPEMVKTYSKLFNRSAQSLREV